MVGSWALNSRSVISGGGLIDHPGKELMEATPLAFLLEGEEGEIVELRGGRGMIQRLLDMGFTPSTKIRVIKTNPPGPMLVNVRDARIALSRGVAMKIMVNGVKKRC